MPVCPLSNIPRWIPASRLMCHVTLQLGELTHLFCASTYTCAQEDKQCPCFGVVIMAVDKSCGTPRTTSGTVVVILTTIKASLIQAPDELESKTLFSGT